MWRQDPLFYLYCECKQANGMSDKAVSLQHLDLYTAAKRPIPQIILNSWLSSAQILNRPGWEMSSLRRKTGQPFTFCLRRLKESVHLCMEEQFLVV
ncbi:hypothetical protein AVEN_211154-1 [Araneus ventricosus]|uniref:Uncharacterized protein n=1 Tax=Araneus ventricosus TaxID=182803 RepID=A0A4Y2N031_ARAVE|nr:hypothetical protein AVEN_211154-1 [Araneus ventricosus]